MVVERFPVIAIVGVVVGPVSPVAGIVIAVRAACVAVAVVVVVNADVIVAVKPVVVAAVVVTVATIVVGIVNTGTEECGAEQCEKQGRGVFHGSWTAILYTLFGESRALARRK